MTEPTPTPADDNFLRAYPPATATGDRPALHLAFIGHDLVVETHGENNIGLLRRDSPAPAFENVADETVLFLGARGAEGDAVSVVAYSLPKGTDVAALGDNLQKVGLRNLYGQVSDSEYGLAGYAHQLLRWRRESGFCSVCGSPTESVAGGWSVQCVACKHTVYPPVSPAMLLLVHDGADRVLLAHKPGWGDRYSILAGFVEPGESLEGCCIREAFEETGVRVGDLVYQGSQPWPFPHQVMIGFTGRALDGADTPLTLDETELDRAAWFHVDALPELPGKVSLSRQIIDAWRNGVSRPAP